MGTASKIEAVANELISYEIASKKYVNLTESIKIPATAEVPVFDALRHKGFSGISFPLSISDLVVSDSYDLWQVSLNGTHKPISLTGGFGRRNEIVFQKFSFHKKSIKKIIVGDTLILEAFNRKTKTKGFYKVVAGKPTNPQQISMMPYSFSFGDTRQAEDSNVFVFKIENAIQAPNYYWTSDFKMLHPLTAIAPEKNYNWLKAELINWPSFDGNRLQGVIYKPENFDSSKKYPVILHYYENQSDKLHEYHKPELTSDFINIPYFVSRGYVIVCPDIEYTIGKPGESALSSIISCTKFLQRLPWVNAKKIALEGHSFGGFETNYIITHSKLFACAVSAAGPSDLISSYGSIIGSGFSGQFVSEVHQNRIGCSLWENIEPYIANSPVFMADKVCTPILMMNNKQDKAVPFAQGVEFFTALRRLGKRAWMLQYDDGGHSLYEQRDALDYTMRLEQFFDHYLKDSACPKWMLYGIEAKNKGIETGYELVRERDLKTGKWRTPQEGGLLTDEERKRVEALMTRKLITVTLD